MNSLIKWGARNTVAANLLMVAIVAAGIIQYLSINRENFPKIPINEVVVDVNWPGADPQQVEEQIVLRVEEAVSDIDGVKSIQSDAFENRARIEVDAKVGTDMTRFLNEVKNRVDGISTFPQDAFPPTVRRLSSTEQIMFLTVNGDIGKRRLGKLAREMRDEITALPNSTSVIDIWGLNAEEVSIEISEENLRRYGLTFDDVSRAISGNSINGSSGTVRTEDGNIGLATRNLADTQAEFEAIIIRQAADGSAIRVGDVATVVDGFVDENRYARMDGKESMLIVLMGPEDLNIVALSENVTAWADERRKTLPEGVALEVWYDSKEFFEANVNLVQSNAIIGLILVLIILTLFLRPIVAFWVAAGIGISFIGAFIFLPSAGVTLNFLSLFGLLLVIGIVVDDALIVGESIHRQVERGKTGIDAAIIGTQLVAKPVFFAVITTMLAFTPFILISNEIAQFLKHLSFTIMFALVFSLIESFLILPAHLSHMKPENKNNLFYKLQRFFADGIVHVGNTVYRPLIKLAINMRYFTVAIFFGAFSISIALLAQGWVKTGFMPDVEGSFINIDITPQEGTPFKRNREIYDIVYAASEELRAELKQENGDKSVIEGAYMQANDRGFFAFMNLVPSDQRPVNTKTIADRLRVKIGDIPDAEDISLSFSFSDGSDRLFYGIESRNLDNLRLASEDMQAYLRSVTGVYDVRDALQSATDEINVNLRSGAERFGLTLAEVTRQVRQAYYGQEVQRLPRNGTDVRVMVRYPRETRESLNSLNTFRIRTADGREVPLAVVAEISYAPSFKRISRYDRKRSTTISGEIREGVDKGLITKDFKEVFIPEWQTRHPDVKLRERGGDQEQADFNRELSILIIGALFAMYILLAIGFSSYAQPLLIMVAIPFAFMGAVYGHQIFGVKFAMFSIFGVCAAGGVVINDNLVLVDYVNRLRAQGVGAYAALVEAGCTRFRPIILTSITTFVGLFPILLENSFDAQFLRPAVVSLTFGVTFALFVTLLFVPALYAVGVDIKRFYKGLWTGQKQPPLSQGASRGGVTIDIDDLEEDWEGQSENNRPSKDGNINVQPAE